MAISMIVTPGQVLGTCFQSEQARFNAYTQATQVTFPLSATAINYGSTTPTVDQQAIPWYRINPDGTPDKLYSYVNGYWIAPNPVPTGSPISFFYNGTLNSLSTYDGGEGTFVTNPDGTITPSIPITSTTGPMWQADTTMLGCSALGVSNTAVIITDAYGNTINQWAQGSQIGEIQHTLTTQELAPHSHFVPLYNPNGTGTNPYGGSGGGLSLSAATTVTGGDTVNNVANVPIGHNNIPPSRVGYWVQRSARIFYRI